MESDSCIKFSKVLINKTLGSLKKAISDGVFKAENFILLKKRLPTYANISGQRETTYHTVTL